MSELSHAGCDEGSDAGLVCAGLLCISALQLTGIDRPY